MTNGDQEKPQQTKPEDAPKGASSDATKASEEAPNQSGGGKSEPTTTTGKIKGEEKKPEKLKESARPKAATSGEKRPFPLFAMIALFIALVAVAAGYWQYRQSQLLLVSVDRLDSRQSALDQQLTDLNAEITDLQNKQQSQHEALVSRIEQGEDSRRAMRVSLDQLSNQIKSLTIAKGQQPLYWRVSEVEYLLTVANRRLTLARDVDTARVALQDADNRLRAIGDPGLIPVREKISQELNRLNSVELPDIAGMSAQLGTLVDDTQQLPFVSKSMTLEQEPATASDRKFTGFTDFVETVWDDLVDGLFRVQRTDEPVKPLMPPQEKQYLMHNLRLKLEQARVALLQGNTELFHAHLADTEQWVKQYFDPEAQPVTHVLATVRDLQDRNLTPELPDISGSLRELRAWMATQELAPQALADTRPSQFAKAGDEVTSP